MSTIKTTISIQKPLFQKLEAAAADLNISRSKALAIALEAWLERLETEAMIANLNEVYGDGKAFTDEDRDFLHKAARNLMREHVDEW